MQTRWQELHFHYLNGYSMPPHQPGLIVLTLTRMQRQAELFHRITGCEP
jgi:hypothetical protein